MRLNDITLVEKPVYYETAYNTGNNMTIGLPLTSWEVIPAIGDEIAAYDESGRLIEVLHLNRWAYGSYSLGRWLNNNC